MPASLNRLASDLRHLAETGSDHRPVDDFRSGIGNGRNQVASPEPWIPPNCAKATRFLFCFRIAERRLQI